jgi:hypothetical protein
VSPDPADVVCSEIWKDGAFRRPELRYVLSAQAVRGRKLVLPNIELKDEQGDVDAVIVAREGEVLSARPGQLILRLQKAELATRDGDRGFFEDRVIDLPLPRSPGRE